MIKITLLTLSILILSSCTHIPKSPCPIPNQRDMGRLYTIFEKEGDGWYITEKGMRDLELRDEINEEYNNRLKEVIRDCREGGFE